MVKSGSKLHYSLWGIGDLRDKLTFLLNLPTTSLNCEISVAYRPGVVNHQVSSIPQRVAISATAALVTSAILLDCGRLDHTRRPR